MSHPARLALVLAAAACSSTARDQQAPRPIALDAGDGDATAEARAAIDDAPAAPADARAAAATAPLTADTPIAAADLAADVATLRELLETLHPGLDRYTTRAQRDAGYAALLAEAGPAPTLGSTYLALSRFTASLRCGHTFVNPVNQDDAVQAALFGGPKLPFRFRWIDRRMVVSVSADPRLPPGTVVETLDGHRTEEVLAALLPLARADGANDHKRIASLEVRGDERHEAFDRFYPRVFARGAGPYQLAVRRPDGSADAFALAPATDPPAPHDTPTGDGPAWQLELLDRRTGYLRMPTWALYNSAWDWRASLDAIATTLVQRKVRRLIVDLRGNEGGLDVGDQLIRHLIARPLPVTGSERRVRYRSVPEALRAPLDTWDPGFFDWGADAVPRADGWYDLTAEAADRTLTPVAPRFRGKVIVLVDGSNSSATFQFAATVQRLRLATLVGEPTGGNQRGINGGAFFFVRLPGTHLEVDLPLIGRFPAGVALADVPDAGVVPDVLALTTADDLARGHDRALAAARALR